MFDFGGRERLGKGVGDHVVCRAIDERKVALANDPSNKMKTYIDVLGSGVILLVFGKGDG